MDAEATEAVESKKPKRDKEIDWESVYRDYRAGILSLREIARIHGCRHEAIRRRAYKEGWTRDLGERIRAAAHGMVAVSVTSGGGDDEIVRANASMQAEVILRHRKDIAQHQEIVRRHQGELDAAGEMNLFSRVEVHKRLVDTAAKLIELERKVLGIDDARTPGQTLDDYLTSLAHAATT